MHGNNVLRSVYCQVKRYLHSTRKNRQTMKTVKIECVPFKNEIHGKRKDFECCISKLRKTHDKTQSVLSLFVIVRMKQEEVLTVHASVYNNV